MAIRERLKKTFSRRKSSTSQPSSSTSSDPSDRSSSIFYQPGEKIPYKYRRPVEPAHQKKLDGFSFADAWRRNSGTSQYSPMGSRMPSRQPSRQGSEAMTSIGGRMSFSMKRGGSNSMVPKTDENGSPNHLTPIESVPVTRMEPADPSKGSSAPFSQHDIDAAIQKAKTKC